MSGSRSDRERRSSTVALEPGGAALAARTRELFRRPHHVTSGLAEGERVVDAMSATQRPLSPSPEGLAQRIVLPSSLQAPQGGSCPRLRYDLLDEPEIGRSWHFAPPRRPLLLPRGAADLRFRRPFQRWRVCANAKFDWSEPQTSFGESVPLGFQSFQKIPTIGCAAQSKTVSAPAATKSTAQSQGATDE
jgi:hypothetical protein